jgi:hypothetical protein
MDVEYYKRKEFLISILSISLRVNIHEDKASNVTLVEK